MKYTNVGSKKLNVVDDENLLFSQEISKMCGYNKNKC